MKRTFCFLLCFCLFINVPFTASCYSARSMVVVEAGTRSVIDSVDCNRKMPMASTTKIITALVVLDILSLDASVTIPADACGVEGSSVYLKAGEVLTVQELLYALMLASGNDAAVALSIAAAGSVDSFVLLMNQKANALGLKNTHFTNPSGLPDDNHYTTAYELALIACHALENADFAQIVSCKSKSISYNNVAGGRYLTNHNKLLFMYEHAIGIKTGFTKKAGRCLVSASKKDGVTLVCVTLNAPDDWNDHISAYQKGFDAVDYGIVARKGDIRISLTTPDGRSVICENKSDIYGVRLNGVEATKKIFAPRFVYAPKASGQSVGEVAYYINGERIGASPLCLTRPVDIQFKKQFSILQFIKGLFK